MNKQLTNKQKKQIHTVIQDKNLPDCLKQKAVFGNMEQINALREIEAIIARAEENGVVIQEGVGVLKKFKVTLSWEAEIDVDVWATDKEHAETVARRECERPDSWDIEYTGAFCREVS